MAIGASERFSETGLFLCYHLSAALGQGELNWGEQNSVCRAFQLLRGVRQPRHNFAFPTNLDGLQQVSLVLTKTVISKITWGQPCSFCFWLWAKSTSGALILTRAIRDNEIPGEPFKVNPSLDWDAGASLCYSHQLPGLAH